MLYGVFGQTAVNFSRPHAEIEIEREREGGG